MGELGFFALFGAIAAIGASLFLGPIGQAIARRIAGTPPKGRDGLSTGEMAAERVAGLEARVVELEERLDFTERLLAQGNGEPSALPDRTP